MRADAEHPHRFELNIARGAPELRQRSGTGTAVARHFRWRAASPAGEWYADAIVEFGTYIP
jgi:hypothetical protein